MPSSSWKNLSLAQAVRKIVSLRQQQLAPKTVASWKGVADTFERLMGKKPCGAVLY